MSEWQTIQTAPKEAILVITASGYITKAVPELFEISEPSTCIVWINLTESFTVIATHWQPLPEPPTT